MTKIKIVIAEDDPTALEIVRQLVSPLTDFEIVGTAKNGMELVDLNFNLMPHLALVDVRMPQLDGIQAIEECIKVNPALKFIFITAYQEYAVKAFDLAAVDYIVKPLEKTRLYRALQKARTEIRLIAAEGVPSDMVTGSRSEATFMKQLIIKSQSAISIIPFKSILFVEKSNRKTLIHTREKSYQTYETLESLKKKLGEEFIASHRSFIVNLHHICEIRNDGETFSIHFFGSTKHAYASKLKVQELQTRLKHGDGSR